MVWCPGHAHRHRLVDAGRDEVADRRAPKVVENERGLQHRLALAIESGTPVLIDFRAGEAGRNAGRTPCLPEVADRLAPTVEDVERERRLAAGGAVLALAALALGSSLQVGEPRNLFVLTPGPGAEALKAQHHRVLVQICYCSFYDDCWVTQSIVPIRERARCPDFSPFEPGPTLLDQGADS